MVIPLDETCRQGIVFAQEIAGGRPIDLFHLVLGLVRAVHATPSPLADALLRADFTEAALDREFVAKGWLALTDSRVSPASGEAVYTERTNCVIDSLAKLVDEDASEVDPNIFLDACLRGMAAENLHFSGESRFRILLAIASEEDGTFDEEFAIIKQVHEAFVSLYRFADLKDSKALTQLLDEAEMAFGRVIRQIAFLKLLDAGEMSDELPPLVAIASVDLQAEGP